MEKVAPIIKVFIKIILASTLCFMCGYFQCCGAGAGGAEIIWDLEPEPKLNF